MDEQTIRMIQQLKSDPAALQTLMQSPDGQALLQLLSGGDRGASLQRAAQSAVRGDPAEMARMVRQVMNTPDGAALVTRRGIPFYTQAQQAVDTVVRILRENASGVRVFQSLRRSSRRGCVVSSPSAMLAGMRLRQSGAYPFFTASYT